MREWPPEEWHDDPVYDIGRKMRWALLALFGSLGLLAALAWFVAGVFE